MLKRSGIEGGVGPFTLIFRNSIARVLDQSLIVGDMEQTIGMLAESTGLSYKSVQRALEHLEALGLVRRGRRVANANTYIFNVELLKPLLKAAQDLIYRIERGEKIVVVSR